MIRKGFHANGSAPGPVIYEVASKSTPGKWWKVYKLPDGLACECPAFAFRKRGSNKKCNHVKLIEEAIKRIKKYEQ